MFHKNIKLIIAGLLQLLAFGNLLKTISAMDFPYIIDCDSNFLYFKNEFILLAFLKLKNRF
jgi:hypothetical protein